MTTQAKSKKKLRQQQQHDALQAQGHPGPHRPAQSRGLAAALLVAACSILALPLLAGDGSAATPSALPSQEDGTICQGQVVTVQISQGQWATGGADVVMGTPGDDVIKAWGGDDVICGGGGDDTIVGGGGNDTCDGGSGSNTINCETDVTGVVATPTPTSPPVEDGTICQGQVVTVQISQGQWATGGADVVMGTPGDDVIKAWGGDDVICGGGGDDTIVGGGGNDTCDGGSGSNTISCESDVTGDTSATPTPGAVTPTPANPTPVSPTPAGATPTSPPTGGATTCQGQTVTVQIGEGQWTTGGADVVMGTAGNDLIRGWGGDDIICGGGGNDTIVGGGGNDTCDGGSGENVIFCDVDVTGGDTPTNTPVPQTPTPTPTPQDPTLPTPTPTPVDLGPTSGQSCNGKAVTVYLSLQQWPTSQDDVILGTPQDDVINGFGGNDTICGMDGDDRITGGSGTDNLRGGNGADEIFGNDGADAVDGGPGNDAVWGGKGNDTLTGAGGDDDLWGGQGEDTLRGANGDDLLYGGPGNDKVFGEADNDELRGGTGADILEGGSGADHLRGNAGADSLRGGPGVDICTDDAAGSDVASTQCETNENDPGVALALPASTWTPPPTPAPAAVPWEIAVTFSQNDPGDPGFVDFGNGQKQYVSGYCRANLSAAVPVVVRDWDTHTNLLQSTTSFGSCSDLLEAATGTGVLSRPDGSIPEGYPQLVRMRASDGHGHMDFGDGRREDVATACFTQLVDAGMSTAIAPWEYISSLQRVDQYTGVQACNSMQQWFEAQDPAPVTGNPDGDPSPTPSATPLPPANPNNEIHPLGYRVLDNANDSGDHGWFDFGNGTKQFVNVQCRERLVAEGAQLVAPDFNAVTNQLTNIAGAGYQCDELVAKIMSPGPLPTGANFTTHGSTILDPYGEEFVPYGANVSGDFYVSESWNSKPIDKLGVYRGTWGFNTLRVNAFCRRDCRVSGQTNDTYKDLHELIEVYEGTGVVLIIDFHSLDFPQAPNADEIEMVTEFFIDMAERYTDNPYVWFNPYNEPINECDLDKHGASLRNVVLQGDASVTWVDIHQPVMDAIRAAGNNNIITLTASNYGQDRCQNHTGGIGPDQSGFLTFGPQLSAQYDNLVYDLHFYSRWAHATEYAIDDYFDRLEQAGLPVVVGEIGGNPNSRFAYQRDDYQAAETFFEHAPDHIGVLAWHTAFGYSLVTSGLGGDAFALTPNDGTRPNNLSEFGALFWNHWQRRYTGPVS